MKLENILNLAKCMVNYVPTHATLSSRTWMRAFQIDQKHGILQRQSTGVLLRLHCLHVRTDVLDHTHALMRGV